MKSIFPIATIALVLAGCAQTRTQALSLDEQQRIRTEVEASRLAAAKDFPRYLDICRSQFPDATETFNDAGARISDQGAVNVALTSGGIPLVCSVSRQNMLVERIWVGSRIMTYEEYKEAKYFVSSGTGAPSEAAPEPIKPAAPDPSIKAIAKVTEPTKNSNAILLEACNNIADSAKRLDCFKAIQKNEQSPAADNRAEVSRAFIDLKSILNAGTSYNSYSLQMEVAVKALGNFQAAAQSEEDKRAAARLQQAIEAYKDAQLFWQRDISWYARSSNSTAYPGGLPIEYTGTAYLVPKYNLFTQKSDFWGFSQGLPRAPTLRTIWKYASDKADAAFQ